MVKVTFNIPEAIYKSLRAEAFHNKTTMTNIVVSNLSASYGIQNVTPTKGFSNEDVTEEGLTREPYEGDA